MDPEGDENGNWEWLRPFLATDHRASSSVQALNGKCQVPKIQPQQPEYRDGPLALRGHQRWEGLKQHGDAREREDGMKHEPFRDSLSRVALQALIDNKITLVEYGAQVQFRCGYKEVPVVVEWGVPDEQLQQASQILVDHKFPPLHDPPRVEVGYWDTGCLRHGLDGSGWMRVHLLPLLLVGFTLQETIEVPSLFNPKVQIRTPLPLRYMLSLINHLKKLPMGDSSRNPVRKDLYSFMAY